jgi:hypothetical protein
VFGPDAANDVAVTTRCKRHDQSNRAVWVFALGLQSGRGEHACATKSQKSAFFHDANIKTKFTSWQWRLHLM